MNVIENYKNLKEEIYSICQKINRKANEIEILPITKGIHSETIMKLYEFGIREFGENRVQEAEVKIHSLPRDIKWHLVGHLQQNKVKKALMLFQSIDSIDRFEIIENVEKRSKKIEGFLEFNCSQEERKHGFKVDNWESAFEKVLDSHFIDLIGLLTMGPYPPDEYRSRKAFEKLRIIKEKAEEKYNIKHLKLSMGTSDDFIYAIMEGANILRIGRRIFK